MQHVVRTVGASVPESRTGNPRRPAMPFITADDGAQIFYKDWGADHP